MIRPATIHDVPRIQEIINCHAELGKMLFKSFAQLFEALRDFAVYETRQASSSGCVALTIIWADLAEVRSLAVDDALPRPGHRPAAGRVDGRRGPPAGHPQADVPDLRAEVLREARLRGRRQGHAAAQGLERLRPLPEARRMRRDRDGAAY